MKKDQTRGVALGDLAQLTLRANVAFAVRCALRLRPCFDLPADAPGRLEQMAALDGAIRVALAFCRGLPGEAGRAIAAARLAAVVAEDTCEATNFAGFAAVRAAEAAANAEEFVRNPSDAGIMEVVAAAFGAGRVVAANADAFTLDLVASALRGDVDRLRSLAPGASKELGVAIDPAEDGPLGPLWPAGAPIHLAVGSQPPGGGE